MKTYEFDAVITEARQGCAWIELPFDGIAYRGALVPMGGEKHIVGMLKEISRRKP